MPFSLETRGIAVDDTHSVSSVWAVPEGFVPGEGDALILAHGAGNDMDSPFMRFFHEALAERGLLTVKFNFPYKEAGRKAPDPAARLESTWHAVLAAVRDAALAPRRIVIGGKSMGGRLASHLASQGESVAGLVFLGYPLHPANKPEKLRADHLKSIACPMLFVQGSRDPLCQLPLLEEILESLGAPAKLLVIEGGDHSFKLPKRAGRSEVDVWRSIAEEIGDWLDAL